jgi:diguanylate cyclase (GGDEF)-like protein/PAS domain S-box-containing protein
MSAADLVASSSEDEAGDAVRKAVAALVPEGEEYRFCYVRGVADPGEAYGLVGTGWASVADLPAVVAAQFQGFESALVGEAVIGSVDGKLPHRNRAYLAADDHVLTALQPSFEALMAQGTLAVERITLTKEINRRSSEYYFRALIQSASDVILIVGDDEEIRYASPSALPVFGRTDLVGTSLFRLFAGTDHAELRALLAQAGSGRGSRDGVDLTAISGDDLLLQVECTCRDLRDDPTVGGLVITIRDVTERRRLESDLAHQAYHDSLTGLANRSLFQNRLEQAALAAESTHGTVAVLFVDLDDFKEVNDSLGHAAGDQLLVEVAHRLRGLLRKADTVARLGGDEFVVLLDGVVAPGWQHVVCDAITAAIHEPFVIDGRPVEVGVSIGVAVSSEGACDPDHLLREADAAMYRAKSAAKRAAPS